MNKLLPINKISKKRKVHLTSIIIDKSSMLFFFLLLIFNIFFTDNFLSFNTLWNLIIHATPTLIIALGMTLVISSGGIDISVGSIMAITGMTLAQLMTVTSLGIALLVALLVGVLIGTVNGLLISIFNLQPTIVTLGMMITGRGLAQVIGKGYILRVDSFTLSQFSMLRLGDVPVQIIYVVLFTVIFLLISKKTTFARYIEAIGDNISTAKLAGINVKFILVSVYTIAGFMAALAGILIVSRAGAADPDTIGKSLEMNAIAATAIGETKMTGGKAKILGTVMGTFILQLVTTTVNMNNISYEWSLLASALIIIGAVSIQNTKKDGLYEQIS